MKWPSNLPALDAGADELEVTLQRLFEAVEGSRERITAEPALAEAVIAVLAASRPLTETLLNDPHAIGVLGQVQDAVAPWATKPDDANHLITLQRRSLLHIAARDLMGLDDVAVTTAALSALACQVLEAALRLADAEGLTVVGMGKLGAGELNYASDVDLMFVGEGSGAQLTRSARRVMDLTARCYRVDITLRPEGRDGAMIRSVDSYRVYWDRWAAPWEFQALLKASVVAGDPIIGAEFGQAAAHALWDRPFGPDDLRSVRALKARSEAATERRGAADRDLKLGPGGIRDVEFSVQILQLVHGHSDPALRLRPTLAALAELGRAGYVGSDDADGLDKAYRFLRRAEHALQLADGHQTHVLPKEPSQLDAVARVLGYRGTPEARPGTQLDAARRSHRSRVRAIHERLYFRPLLEAFADVPGALTPVAAAARLGAFGFSDAARTRSAVRELTSGLNRSSRLMAQMLPLILDWLSTSPDPDQGLLGLRSLVGDRIRGPRVTATFRESPEAARRLCMLLGTSAWLAETVSHDPELVGKLPTIGRHPAPTRGDVVDAAQRAISWRAETGERQGGLRRWKDRQVLTVAVADLLDDASVAATGQRLATIAEATLEAALVALEPQVPFAVIAAGRLGGRELAYHSDLDLLFVHAGSEAADDEEANRIAAGLIRFVSGTTPAERLYAIDPDLRPEGRQGPLSRTLAGFQAYWERWAAPWERLAMVRAHPVAGDRGLGRSWSSLLDRYVWGAPLSDSDLREIRLVKARMERERIPATEDPKFHLKLGRGALADVELCIQLLQLQARLRAEDTPAAIASLTSDDVLTAPEATVLEESYEWCERVRNRWHLLRNGPGDSLPADPESLARLARSLTTTPAELRDDYLRVTRRARVVVERHFYAEA